MFARRAVQHVLTTSKRQYTPSIKFVYGNRAEIEKEMANRPPASFFVDHSKTPAPTASNPAAAVENTQRHEGKSVKHGQFTTKVVHMEAGWYGNPFVKQANVPTYFEDKAINMINLGGAL